MKIYNNLKKIGRGIYNTISPAYRGIHDLKEKLYKVENDIDIIKNTLNEYINSTNTKEDFYQKCSELFLQKDEEPNYKIDLCAKFLLMSQDDIVKNLCNYIIRGKSFLIYDIGANKGDVSKIMLDCDSTKNSIIYAYEPIKEMEGALFNLKNQYKNFDYKMIGIGEKNDYLPIKYNTAIEGLTSFKKIKDNYRYFACNKNDTKIQNDLYKVSIKTLDSEYFEKKNLEIYKNIALKIDVQGFEMEVLNGCEQLFKNEYIKAILIECTTVQKYETACTYEKIFEFMHSHNFVIFDLLPVYREIDFRFHQDNKGHLTEFDAIFVNRNFILENKV